MRFVRLLNDSPEFVKGSVFELRQIKRYHGPNSFYPYTYVDVYEAVNGEGHYNVSVVEDNPNWFEEVEQIFVRPFNAEKLNQIDQLASQEGDIVQPFYIDGAIIKRGTK